MIEVNEDNKRGNPFLDSLPTRRRRPLSPTRMPHEYHIRYFRVCQSACDINFSKQTIAIVHTINPIT
jgi:hypothetical protein